MEGILTTIIDVLDAILVMGMWVALLYILPLLICLVSMKLSRNVVDHNDLDVAYIPVLNAMAVIILIVALPCNIFKMVMSRNDMLLWLNRGKMPNQRF